MARIGTFKRTKAGISGRIRTADIARAQAGALGQLLLRHVPIVAFSTQVHRHDLLEIHGAMGALRE